MRHQKESCHSLRYFYPKNPLLTPKNNLFSHIKHQLKNPLNIQHKKIIFKKWGGEIWKEGGGGLTLQGESVSTR